MSYHLFCNLLYYNNILFGGLYDNRFLIKKTITNAKYHLSEASPYEGAKPMLFVEETDDKTYLQQLIIDTVSGLKK